MFDCLFAGCVRDISARLADSSQAPPPQKPRPPRRGNAPGYFQVFIPFPTPRNLKGWCHLQKKMVCNVGLELLQRGLCVKWPGYPNYITTPRRSGPFQNRTMYSKPLVTHPRQVSEKNMSFVSFAKRTAQCNQTHNQRPATAFWPNSRAWIPNTKNVALHQQLRAQFLLRFHLRRQHGPELGRHVTMCFFGAHTDQATAHWLWQRCVVKENHATNNGCPWRWMITQ